MKYKIAPMGQENIESVAALEAKCFSEPWSAKGFADALKPGTNLFLTASDPEGMLLGYCGLYCSEEEGEITNVAVTPEARGNGIGQALVAELLREASERGIREIFLEVRVSNASAIYVYEKNGFRSVGIRKNFYRKPQEDASIMQANLTRKGFAPRLS